MTSTTKRTCSECGKAKLETEANFRIIMRQWGSVCTKCINSKRTFQTNEEWKASRKSLKHRQLRHVHIGNARRKGVLHQFSVAEWEWLLDLYGHRCAYCGIHESEVRILEQEHVIPATKKGPYTLSNIVPSCTRCNRKKTGRTPQEAGMEMAIKRNVLAHLKQLPLPLADAQGALSDFTEIELREYVGIA